MLSYKIILGSELSVYKAGLIHLIDPENKRPEEILKSLRNSNIIVLAFDSEKVVGSNQVITDMYFSALLLNLIVDPKYRKRGIAGEIMQKTLDYLMELKIKNIDLVADPGSPWLVDFYAKFGFELGGKGGTYMHFDKKLHIKKTQRNTLGVFYFF